MPKIVRRGVIMVLLLGALVVLSAPSTSHTASARTASVYTPLDSTCYNNDSSCSGKDPYNTIAASTGYSCGFGGKSIASRPVIGGVVILMWSVDCGTNWTETDQYDSSGKATHYIANANITRWSDGRHYDATNYDYDVVSLMVWAPNTPARACGSINNWTGGCTGWY